jgi:hypothetical protein
VRDVGGRRNLVVIGDPAFQIYDVDDPASPQLVAQVALAVRRIAVEDTTAYLIDAGSVVYAYDLSIPKRPRLISKYEPRGAVAWSDVAAANGLLYLSDANGSGLHVVDFRDAPGELASEPTTTSHAATSALTSVAGRTLALASTLGPGSKLRVLDGAITSPTYLQPLGELAARTDVALHDLHASGARVYAANRRDGVRVIDLSDPTKPAVVGYFNTWTEGTGSASNVDGALGLDIDRSRGLVYVADATRGLVILAGDAVVFP